MHGKPAIDLRISTSPTSNATDAYYQELLGIAIATLLAQIMPIHAFSDCSSAITRARQALSHSGPAIGHLQHGSLLLGLRSSATQCHRHHTLTWTPSHPERSKPQSRWTEQDWGIHLADGIAGAAPPPTVEGIQIYRCDSAAVHAALTPVGTWQWCDGPNPFHGSVLKRAQQHTFRQYTQKRDMKRIYANEPTR
jgi:hypothetical protein